MELGPRDRSVPGVLARGAQGPHHRYTPHGQRRSTSTCATSGAAKLHERLPQICEVARDVPRRRSGRRRRFRCVPRCTTRWAESSADMRDRFAAARPLRRGRMLEHRHPRRQPAGFQLARRARASSARWRASRRRNSRASAGRRQAIARAIGRREAAQAALRRALGARARRARIATLRNEMAWTHGAGRAASIRIGRSMQATCDKLAELQRALPRGVKPRRPLAAPGIPMAHGDRAGLPCSTVAEAIAHSAPQPHGVARRAPASRRLRPARRRALPQAHPRLLRAATDRPRIDYGAGHDHQVAAEDARVRRRGQASRARTLKRHVAWQRRRPKLIEIEVLRYQPGDRPRAPLPVVPGAVHRRHVGAAGAAVHQGRSRRHPHLPLVLPDGDLRQLRHDDQRRAASSPCMTFLRDYYPNNARASSRSRISRSSATWCVDQSRTSCDKLERSSPIVIPQEPRTLAEGEYLQTPAQLRALRVRSATASTACSATPPVRNTGSNPAFIGPGGDGAAASLQRRFARRRAARSAWSS